MTQQLLFPLHMAVVYRVTNYNFTYFKLHKYPNL